MGFEPKPSIERTDAHPSAYGKTIVVTREGLEPSTPPWKGDDMNQFIERVKLWERKESSLAVSIAAEPPVYSLI